MFAKHFLARSGEFFKALSKNMIVAKCCFVILKNMDNNSTAEDILSKITHMAVGLLKEKVHNEN